jgi:uncharacterized protein
VSDQEGGRPSHPAAPPYPASPGYPQDGQHQQWQHPPYSPYPHHPQYPQYPAYPQQPAYPQRPGWQRPEPDPRWEFPHEQPREYHQVLRTWTYRTWKPIVGVVLLLLGMIIVLPLLAFPILLVGAAFESGDGDYLQTVLDAATLERLTPSGLLYLNVALGALILWCGLLTRVLHHLRLRWLSSVVPKLRWKFMAACAAVAVVALVAQVVVGALLPSSANPDVSTEPNPLTATTIALIVVVALSTPFQAAGEEYAFRGYLLQAVGALARHKWISIVLTALLFAVAHLQFSPPLFFDRFMFGLIAAWLVIRTGGLEAGIALHVLNNWLAFGFAIAFTDLESALDPGEVSWWNVPVTLTQSLVYAVLVLWLARRMNVQRTSRPPHLEADSEPSERAPATVV